MSKENHLHLYSPSPSWNLLVMGYGDEINGEILSADCGLFGVRAFGVSYYDTLHQPPNIVANMLFVRSETGERII